LLCGAMICFSFFWVRNRSTADLWQTKWLSPKHSLCHTASKCYTQKYIWWLEKSQLVLKWCLVSEKLSSSFKQNKSGLCPHNPDYSKAISSLLLWLDYKYHRLYQPIVHQQMCG